MLLCLMTIKDDWRRRLRNNPNLAVEYVGYLKEYPDEVDRVHPVYILIAEKLGVSHMDFDFASLPDHEVIDMFKSGKVNRAPELSEDPIGDVTPEL